MLALSMPVLPGDIAVGLHEFFLVCHCLILELSN